jgi:hypothetical protein
MSEQTKICPNCHRTLDIKRVECYCGYMFYESHYLTDEENLPVNTISAYKTLQHRPFFLEKSRALFPTINLTKKNIAFIIGAITVGFLLCLSYIYLHWGYL